MQCRPYDVRLTQTRIASTYLPESWNIQDRSARADVLTFAQQPTDGCGLRLLPVYAGEGPLPLHPGQYDNLRGALVQVALEITDYTYALPSGRIVHDFSASIAKMTVLKEANYRPYCTRSIDEKDFSV